MRWGETCDTLLYASAGQQVLYNPHSTTPTPTPTRLHPYVRHARLPREDVGVGVGVVECELMSHLFLDCGKFTVRRAGLHNLHLASTASAVRYINIFSGVRQHTLRLPILNETFSQRKTIHNGVVFEITCCYDCSEMLNILSHSLNSQTSGVNVTQYRTERRYVTTMAVRQGILIVRPPSEWFWSGTNDSFVAVSATFTVWPWWTVGLNSSMGFAISVLWCTVVKRSWDIQRDGHIQTGGQTDRSQHG